MLHHDGGFQRSRSRAARVVDKNLGDAAATSRVRMAVVGRGSALERDCAAMMAVRQWVGFKSTSLMV